MRDFEHLPGGDAESEISAWATMPASGAFVPKPNVKH